MHETGRLKWTLSIRQFRSEARPTSHRPIHFDLGDNSKQCQSLFTTGGRRAPGTPPPRDTLPTFLASKPFQIMRHSVHACHEFNFRLQPSRNEFPTSPPTRRTRSPVSLIADEATKKRARSLSLCDGNDFPATVASRRVVPRATPGEDVSAAPTLLLALLATPFAAYTCFLRLPSALSLSLFVSSPKFKAGGGITPHLSVTSCCDRPAGFTDTKMLTFFDF